MARLALAQGIVGLAWTARGSGPASTVTEEGWKDFHASIAEAKELLQPIDPANAPPDYYRLQFEIAKAESWDRERIDELVEHLMRSPHRGFVPAHTSVALALLPRWGGLPGETEAYAHEIADQIDGPAGAAVYAQIATDLLLFHNPHDFFPDTDFDYDRIRNGLEELEKRGEQTGDLMNAGLCFAWLKKDHRTARRCAEWLEAEGTPVSLKMWSHRELYEESMQWSQSDDTATD